MFRKRERFARSDVPRTSMQGTIMAVVALVFVIVGIICGILWAQKMARRDANLEDGSLSSGVSAQASLADPAEGYVVSEDEFVNVLIFTVDDPTASAQALKGAQLLSINKAKGTGVLVNLPLDAEVTVDDAPTSLTSLFSSKGAGACVAPLSQAANVPVSHVVVATDKFWDQLDGLRAGGMKAVLSGSSELLMSIKTDMSASEALDLAQLLGSVGTQNLQAVDAPTADGGTAGTKLDGTGLGVAVGRLVANA